MEVNLNVNSARPVASTNPQPKVIIQAGSTDAVEFGGASALRDSFDKIPDVRPDVVARARALVSKPNYPPTEIIKKIATLIAYGMDQKSAEL